MRFWPFPACRHSDGVSPNPMDTPKVASRILTATAFPHPGGTLPLCHAVPFVMCNLCPHPVALYHVSPLRTWRWRFLHHFNVHSNFASSSLLFLLPFTQYFVSVLTLCPCHTPPFCHTSVPTCRGSAGPYCLSPAPFATQPHLRSTAHLSSPPQLSTSQMHA